MARCPFAVWDPLPENDYQPRITPTQVILHSAVDAPGRTNLQKYFARADVKLESHFWIYNDGTIVQMMDTEVRADANRTANVRAISIETEDDGNPNQRRWTDAQIDAIIKVVAWACETHGIPARVCPAHDKPGIGYHTLFGAPSPWTPVSKTCPGTIRKTQFPGIVEGVKFVLEGSDPMADQPHQKMYTHEGEVLVVQNGDTRFWVRDLDDVALFQFFGVELREVDETFMKFIKRYTINGDLISGGVAGGGGWLAAAAGRDILARVQANYNSGVRTERALDRVEAALNALSGLGGGSPVDLSGLTAKVDDIRATLGRVFK